MVNFALPTPLIVKAPAPSLTAGHSDNSKLTNLTNADQNIASFSAVVIRNRCS